MRMRVGAGIGRGVVALVLILISPQAACSGCGDVNCAGDGLLYVRLPETPPTGAVVRVCVGTNCAEATEMDGGNATVAEADLGTWAADRDTRIRIALMDANRRPLGEWSTTASKEDGDCCPDYWVVAP